MKKTLLALIAALALLCPAMADEGMWLLPLLEKINSDALRNLGSRLTPDQIYSINHSSIKDAIVQFGGGCTAEVISDEGLLVTNHHCGYGSITALSSEEHNYLEDGFWAMNRSEEILAPRLTVSFLQKMIDVTAELNSGKTREDIIKGAEAENPHCEAEVVSFFNGNVYYLVLYKTYRDVRFVGAPPASLGKFGGDTDNWMWPRHTCDFSMFRIYAGKDNEPADYSPDNVPYTPKQSLKISLRGVDEGDFAMIMGYPGSTQRFQTAAQLEDMLQSNAIGIKARTIAQDILWKEMRADDKVSLQFANVYSGWSNAWKKWIGMEEAFGNLNVIDRQKQKEADLQKWINKKKSRTELYGGAVEDIEKVVRERSEAKLELKLLSETFGKIQFINNLRAKSVGFPEDYRADIDKKISLAMVKLYGELSNSEFKLPVDEATIEKIFNESAYTCAERFDEAMKAGKDLSEDIAYTTAKAFMDKYTELSKKVREHAEELSAASKKYAAALLEWTKDSPSYPDANFTCRLTYGTVKGYEPKDGVIYKHYTTLKGVIEKEDPGNYEFRVPDKIKELYKASDYGQYANADGELPTCFLTNLDITGGNSGSPVMDADGCLIGLAFDGNWEAMSGDVIFEPNLQRCICVDIRYVLFVLDKVGGAGYLLKEMNIVR